MKNNFFVDVYIFTVNIYEEFTRSLKQTERGLISFHATNTNFCVLVFGLVSCNFFSSVFEYHPRCTSPVFEKLGLKCMIATPNDVVLCGTFIFIFLFNTVKYLYHTLNSTDTVFYPRYHLLTNQTCDQHAKYNTNATTNISSLEGNFPIKQIFLIFLLELPF